MYEKTVRLKHNEQVAKVDMETGEITHVTDRPNNLPNNKVVFNPEGRFKKMYDAAWDYLLDNTTPVEMRIVVKMCQMTRMNSNSLAPLNNTSSTIEIAETFGIHRNHVKRIFTKLLKLGIYAEFKFGAVEGIRHYWVLNPYISFKGKTIDKGILDLFREARLTSYIKDKEC